MTKKAELPRVYWIASPIRPKVRHAAEKITLEYNAKTVYATSLCGVSKVYVTAENDFENMHQCARCHDVIRDLKNAERFFGREVK